MASKGTLICVISDTHGLWREQVEHIFDGVDQIIHAGDVGDPEILTELHRLAPVVAVRGNVDRGEWAKRLPTTAVVTIGATHLYVLHDIHQLDLDPEAVGFAAVISGHSRRPMAIPEESVLYLNPGSAGPRRFNLPLSVALLRVKGKRLDAELVELDVG